MDNIKNDNYYIGKIIDNIDFVLSHTKGMSLQQMQSDEVLVDSVMFRFIQIAESAQELSSSFKTETSSLPWHQINGIRNRIVHAYDIIRVDIIYETILHDLVPFRDNLKKYTKRVIGTYDGKASFSETDNGKITEEEFLGL